VRLRGYGIYSYRISDPRIFFKQISGTRDTFYASQLDGQLHNTIVARMTDIFANSDVAYLDMAAKQATLGAKIAEEMKPAFAALGLELTQFVVESISMPDDLQEIIDQRIGVGMAGDIGRYTQFEAAQALELAAANTGGTAGMGVGIGAGAAMAQAMITPIKPIAGASAPATTAAARFCIDCGRAIPEGAKFCPGCGRAQ
jgi:membrane protease subunit (stomatin/prohibitin family)